MKQRYESIWDAIEDTPQRAASMKAKATLMIELQELLKQAGITQAEAAKKLGVTQPRISDLMRGRIELFSLESLMDMLSSAGMQVQLSVRKAA
jgi:predicted XRE-type DNA-binding protein